MGESRDRGLGDCDGAVRGHSVRCKGFATMIVADAFIFIGVTAVIVTVVFLLFIIKR